MSKEELLKMLRDAGLDDEAVKALLHDALADLEAAPAEEAEEEAEKDDAEAAAKLLGVEF